jgi:hypothetical protein
MCHLMPARFIKGGIFWAVLVLAACGVKGPPTPSGNPPPPAVKELSYHIDGTSVALEWRLTEELAIKEAGKAAFLIYQARSFLNQPDCEVCPPVFEKQAVVPYVHAKDNRFATVVELDAGYRYVIQVRLEVNGQMGAVAEPIQLTIQSTPQPMEK